MATIDERIKQELGQDNELMDDYLADKADFPDMVMDAFKGSLRKMMIFASVLATVFSGLLIWSIIEFVGAGTMTEQISWGVWTILSALGLVLVELFAWMQINRVSTRREIKLLEIQVRKAVMEK